LFNGFPKRKYNLIIANLPIVNFETDNHPINNALYDKNLEIHRRLLMEAKKFLAEDGIITFTHANLQSMNTSDPDRDFQDVEKLIEEFGYEISERVERVELGYKWINYKIKLKV
ncbi:hypothetical protein IT397_02325, partial [Candidatus Nomurabacteria bacterium]|nr:hypothetical protein [Candidatus Nomurabacteria bacterium]